MNTNRFYYLIFLLIIQIAACSEKTNQDLFSDFEVSFQKEQYEDGINILNSILDTDSTTTLIYHARGLCFQKLSKYNEAIADFSKAITLDTENIYALTQRGCSYAMLGDYKSALDDYKKAIILRGFDASGDHANKKYKLSKSEYLKIPLLFDIVYLRGRAYYETYDLIRALDDFNLCIESASEASVNSKFSKLPECYYWRGLTYVRIGEMNRACEDFYVAADSGINQAFEDINKHCKMY